MPKFRYIIVTPANDVFGTDDVERARGYDNDETFVIDTHLGKYSFDGEDADVEVLS